MPHFRRVALVGSRRGADFLQFVSSHDGGERARINTEARPLALQIALMIPLLAGLLGFFNGVRMTRLPDLEPSAAGESVLGG